jgi:hypothetical protein
MQLEGEYLTQAPLDSFNPAQAMKTCAEGTARHISTAKRTAKGRGRAS